MAPLNFKFTSLRSSSVCMCYVVLAVLSYVNHVSSLNDSKDLLLTLPQKDALEKFKAQVTDHLPEEFMKTDFYLIRWLRVTFHQNYSVIGRLHPPFTPPRNFDMKAAHSMLLETLKWREDNNVTQSLYDNWSDLEQDYPQRFGGYDKDGRPVWELPMGEWDLRAASLQGTIRRLQRYLAYGTEKLLHEVLKAQKRNTGNKSVTRAIVLVDAQGFNLRQHGCPACLAVLIQWTLVGELYYPAMTDQIVIFNAPPSIVLVINAVRPFMSANTRSQMKVLGSNKNEWMPYLDGIADRSQRTPSFGGKRQV